MRVEAEDFNAAGKKIEESYSLAWRHVQHVLAEMPLHLKASDQAGIQGSPIFDPVGTNRAIRVRLESKGWQSAVPIPDEFSFLGTDVDFVQGGVLAEVQFSNYPFLVNNVVRSELFFQSHVSFADEPVGIVVIITKARMFPASNSTLYYEQAKDQLKALAAHGVFDVPIRLLGLFEPHDQKIPAVWTEYASRRYSRTIASQSEIRCRLSPGSGRSRSTIHLS